MASPVIRLFIYILTTLTGLWSLIAVPVQAESGGTMLALNDALQSSVVRCGQVHLDSQSLVAYYNPARSPIWINGNGPGPRARSLRDTLRLADREGLPADRYHVAEIEAHWTKTDPAARACLELLLTAGFDRYSREVRRGLATPQEADPTWELQSAPFDPVESLREIREDREFNRLLSSLAPIHPGYQRLRQALAAYRQLETQGGWPKLSPGTALTPGDESELVPPLRARLRIEGDLSRLVVSMGNRYDAALVTAVQHFQRRHGLQPDGVVGTRTRAALNVPVTERVAQLRRALERWRWLPRDLGEHYILVNTAAFELAVIEHGKAVLVMRTINGTPDQATPSFTAMLRSLIINPYWYVPQRIAHDRLWPRARANRHYLPAHGFRIYDTRNGIWKELDPMRLDGAHLNGDNPVIRLRQDPGPRNLMGRLSFVFPNPHDVFLHDTPDRALFDRAVRTFSEGCVRIENAMALAVHTLRRLPEWNQAHIQAEIDALHHRTLPLPEPIPVYVLYLPSWVEPDGQVHFQDDVYRRESVLASFFPANGPTVASP